MCATRSWSWRRPAGRCSAQTLRAGALTLVYTGIGYPKAPRYPGAPAGSAPPRLADLPGQLKTVNIATDLTDGNAMSGFDAATFVVRHLQDGASGGSLIHGFAQFNRSTPFCGTTGPVALVTDDGPRQGDAFEKPVPVLRLMPGTATSLESLYQPAADQLRHC